jgi:transcriptional regulator with XRE-family HTH domain/Zn-dependent peptidase ImmA (M78 family)
MSTPEYQRWDAPGYGDIKAAMATPEGTLVTFANGDAVKVSPGVLGARTADFVTEVDPEDPTRLRVITTGATRDVDWTTIRAATDEQFASWLRERDTEESHRVGRRVRALREDRGLAQGELAKLVGMTPPQLSKLEKGESDMRLSTVRALLRAMDATFADISSPDAPEVSVRELAKRAGRVGVPAEIVKQIAARVDPRELLEVVARAFGWDSRSVLADELAPPILLAPVTLKSRGTPAGDKGQALLALAESLAQRSALAYSGSPGMVPENPEALRDAILGDKSEMTLELLVRWCWESGVLVVPMQAKGGFSAGAWRFGDQPVVVLKEAPDFKARWLFALAHELGHFALGHVAQRSIVDAGSAWNGPNDEQEKAANRYALDLLVPGYREMLDEIERRLEGLDPDAKFKFKAIEAAKARGYNVPLVLLVAAFGLTKLARSDSRWGSANKEAEREGSARAFVAAEFAQRVDLERLDRPDALLIRAVAIG